MVEVLEGMVVADDGMRRLGDVVDGGARGLGEVVDAVAVLVAIFGVPGIGVLGYRSPGILEFWDIVVLDTGFLGILLDGNR